MKHFRFQSRIALNRNFKVLYCILFKIFSYSFNYRLKLPSEIINISSSASKFRFFYTIFKIIKMANISTTFHLNNVDIIRPTDKKIRNFNYINWSVPTGAHRALTYRISSNICTNSAGIHAHICLYMYLYVCNEYICILSKTIFRLFHGRPTAARQWSVISPAPFQFGSLIFGIFYYRKKLVGCVVG